MIVTLTGESDYQVFLWNWEREKLVAKMELGFQSSFDRQLCKFQVSYSPFDSG